MASYPPATEGKCYKGIWGEGWEVGGKGQESSTILVHDRAGHTQGILGGATEEPWCCCEVITVSLYSILLYSLSLYSYFIFYSDRQEGRSAPIGQEGSLLGAAFLS